MSDRRYQDPSATARRRAAEEQVARYFQHHQKQARRNHDPAAFHALAVLRDRWDKDRLLPAELRQDIARDTDRRLENIDRRLRRLHRTYLALLALLPVVGVLCLLAADQGQVLLVVAPVVGVMAVAWVREVSLLLRDKRTALTAGV